MGDWTGTVPTFAAGAKVRGVDLQTIADIDTALTTAWTSFTPVFTAAGGSPAVGNGTISGEYRRLGKIVEYRGAFVFGSTSNAGTGEWYMSTPFTANTPDFVTGSAFLHDSGTSYFSATCAMRSAATKLNFIYQASQVAATVPMTWATGDRIIWNVLFTTA